MDNAQLNQRLDKQDLVLGEIRDALLGSLDGTTVGLIADHRALKTIVVAQSSTLEVQTKTLEEQSKRLHKLETFRAEIKRIVAIVAFSIPIAFELAKGAISFAWDYLTTHK